MTLRSRNIWVGSMLGLVAVFAVAYVSLLFILRLTSSGIQDAVVGAFGRFLSWTWPLQPGDSLLVLISSGIALGSAVVAIIIFLTNFRRLSSAELFFLCVFWLAIGFQALRVCNLLFFQQHTGSQFHLLVSKLFYFGQFLGVLSVVCMSLFLVGVKIQYQGMLLYIALAIAGIATYLLPIDNSQLRQGFVYLHAQSVSVEPILLSLGLLAIINVGINAYAKSSWRELVLVLPFLLMVGGQILFYINAGLLSLIVAWVSLVLATLWLNLRFVRSYVWY